MSKHVSNAADTFKCLSICACDLLSIRVVYGVRIKTFNNMFALCCLTGPESTLHAIHTITLFFTTVILSRGSDYRLGLD
jgi:hypothetical protein